MESWLESYCHLVPAHTSTGARPWCSDLIGRPSEANRHMLQVFKAGCCDQRKTCPDVIPRVRDLGFRADVREE